MARLKERYFCSPEKQHGIVEKLRSPLAPEKYVDVDQLLTDLKKVCLSL